MTPERMARLVARWVRVYTRNLPPPVAERRAGELAADLHDHIDHERAHGTSDRRIALSIAARMARGLPADAAWCHAQKARNGRSRMPKIIFRPAIVTACILVLPLLTTLLADGEGWSVADFVFGAAILMGTGVLIERALQKPGNLVHRIAAAAVGVAAIALGEADDAPGLVLFGLVLIGAAVALTIRTAQRSR
jgi:hypothetical protein